MNNKIKVVITSGYRWSYFQWFLLGLYELEKQGEISLELKLPMGSYILSKLSNEFLLRVVNRLRMIFEEDSYNMDGYIVYSYNDKSEKKFFTIDSADAPYLFDSKKLDSVDCYFKMQCPAEFNEDGFKLTDDIVIPWCDHEHTSPGLKLTERGKRKVITDLKIDKIKPLLSATRSLSRGISYKSLKNGYENYVKARKFHKEKKIMCYFGNALGPVPEAEPIPDYDWERDIMGFFGREISHPNEKRAKVAEILNKIDDTDARVICQSYSDNNAGKDKNLQIPLRDFCAHIAKFEYNVNVSGYRMSIPSRFMESMMVGTAIVTDKLHVKWFKPFEEEVIESVEMGYKTMNSVDWDLFEKDLKKLPTTNPSSIVDLYERKWGPVVVAEYIITTVKNS